MSEDKVEYQAGAVVKESLTVGKHHPTGMSKLPALAQCPFYENDGMTESRNDGKGGYAEEGSEAHRMLAEVMGGADVSLFVDSPHYEAVDSAAGYAKGIEYFLGVKFSPEKRVTIRSGLSFMDGVYGTADLITWTGERVIVIDFKTFGTGEKCHVEQLAGYAFAFGSMIGATEGTACELITYHGAIKRVDKTEMTYGECHAMTTEILRRVHERKDGQRCANEYCRYCKHYGSCEAQRALVAAVVPATVPNAGLLTATREEMMARPQDIPVMLVLVKELETLIDRAKENAVEAIKAHGVRSEDGAGLCAWTLEDDVRGVAWQIRQSPGNRVFRDIAALWEGYASSHITQEEFLRCCTVSAPRLAKAVHAAAGARLADVDAEIGGFAERGEVRETMKRVK